MSGGRCRNREGDRHRYRELIRACSTRSAASAGFWCSHTRTITHPAAARRASVSRSRATLVASFAVHQAALCLGWVAWIGQQCQKQPSTYTATLDRGNSRSARRRRPGRGARSTWKRRPRRCSSRRRPSSGAVSRRRWARRRLRVAADGGSGGSSHPPGGGAFDAGGEDIAGVVVSCGGMRRMPTVGPPIPRPNWSPSDG